MITIGLPESTEESVAVTVSLLLECVLSLHVLVGPREHALQQEWVRRMRSLDRGLRREVAALELVYGRQIPDAFLPTSGAAGFHEELTEFRQLQPELLLGVLGRPLYDHGGAPAAVFSDPEVSRIALERAGERNTPGRDAAELPLADPSAFADRLATLLANYRESGFDAEWQSLEERLARAVAAAGKKLASGGVLSILGRLPRRYRVSASRRELLIDLPHEHRVDVCRDAPLLLIPSYFAWLHVRVNCDPPWPVALICTPDEFARAAEGDAPEADLLRALRAIADDTRLRVLKLIAERPRTTQKLEALVGLSRAGLSKSILRLAEAGLITPKRDGYYVVYSLNRDRLDSLHTSVARYLDG